MTSPKQEPDAFELLGFEKRPWLDPDQIEAAFREQAKGCHPDRDSNSGTAAASLAEAKRTLLSIPSRLHLLTSTKPSQAGGIPPGCEDHLFAAGKVDQAAGTRIQELDRLGPLERAMEAETTLNCDAEVEEILQQLVKLRQQAEDDLRAMDQSWSANEAEESSLLDLSQRFAFLDRWIDQLQSRRLALAEFL